MYQATRGGAIHVCERERTQERNENFTVSRIYRGIRDLRVL